MLAIFLPAQLGWLELVPLPAGGWVYCIVVASLTLWVSELTKWIVNRRQPRPVSG